MQNTSNDGAAQLARLQVAQATDLDLVEKLETGWIKVRTGQADDTLARLQVAQATDLDLVEKLETGWIKVRTGQADDTLATIDIFRRACERRQLVIDGIKSRLT